MGRPCHDAHAITGPGDRRISIFGTATVRMLLEPSGDPTDWRFGWVRPGHEDSAVKRAMNKTHDTLWETKGLVRANPTASIAATTIRRMSATSAVGTSKIATCLNVSL